MSNSSPPIRLSRKTSSFPRRTILFAVALTIVHLCAAYLLDALGLVEGLLSPNGGRLLLLLPLAIFFYAVRLVLYFVVPGLVVGALILWIVDRSRQAPDASAS